MSISGAINAARTGLQVTSLRADTVATNVANAGTPGYVRRSVSISETITGQQTSGVQANGILRSENEALTAQRRSLLSDLSQANVLSSTWASISARVGETSDGGQLFQAFSKFETALSNAAVSPESTALASGLLSAANEITAEFKSLSQMASDMRRQADTEIAAGVETVNNALAQIQDLNAQIASSNRTSMGAAALFDERQRVLDTIADYIPVQTVERESGAIDVLTPEGVFLVAGHARQIEFAPSSSFEPNQTLANGLLSGLTVDGLDITPGADTFGAVSSGMLGALFQVRDEDAPNFSAQLDVLAGDLVTRLSDDAIDGTKTPGEQGLFIDSDPGLGAGIAGRLQINAAIDPAQGGELRRLRDGIGSASPGLEGDATILNNLFSAFTSVEQINAAGISGRFSSTESIANFSSIIGQSRVSREAVYSSTVAQHQTLVEAERSESGVDIDAQMQDLLFIEQAYAANARVIEIASQMLDRLMEL